MMPICQPREFGFIYWSHPVLFLVERSSAGAAPVALWRAEGQSSRGPNYLGGP